MKDEDQPKGGQTLDEAEREALEVLGAELRRHLEVTQAAFNLIALAQSGAETSVRQLSPARLVCLTLLARLSNDLRGSALLAARGYALQAAALTASIYEVSHSIVAIGNDDELAGKWLTHDDPTRPFMSVTELTETALRKWQTGLPDDVGFRQYRSYSQLSMAKHANPLLQFMHGPQVKEGTVAAQNGPDTSDDAIRVAWFALEQAAQYACFALCGFLAAQHVPAERTLGLLAPLHQLQQECLELNRAASERWGTDDPHPDKWRRVQRRTK